VHIIACIEDPSIINKILAHLNAKSGGPASVIKYQSHGHRHKRACGPAHKRSGYCWYRLVKQGEDKRCCSRMRPVG
jgi:hypothetical protein